MIPDRHWWRTADGRLVPDGDRDAAFLAYPRGHEIADNLAEQVGLAAAVRALTGPGDADEADHETGGVHDGDDGADGQENAGRDEAKQAEAAADKMAAKPADKSRAGAGRRAS